MVSARGAALLPAVGMDTAVGGEELIAYKDAVGTTLLKLARKGYDVVRRYGAVPNGTAGNDAATSAAFLNWAGDMATEVNPFIATVPHGTYRINTPNRIVIPPVNGSVINGDAATLLFLDKNGGFDDGVMTTPLAGGSLRGFVFRGAGTTPARSVCRLRWCTGREYDIRCFGGGYYATDTAYQKDESYALCIQASQNCTYRQLAAKDTAHHALVLDYGAGGGRVWQMQLDGAGTGGDPNARQLLIRQSAPATGNILGEPTPHPTVYDRPTNWKFDGYYCEAAGASDPLSRYIEMGTTGIGCSQIYLSGQHAAGNRLVNLLTQIYIGDFADGVTLDGCQFGGNFTAGGKLVTGVQVAGGAKNVRMRGASNFIAMLNCIDLVDVGSVIRVEGSPLWIPIAAGSSRLTGLGARNIINDYKFNANALPGLPTAEACYLGVRAIIATNIANPNDTVYECMRRGTSSTFAWVPISGKVPATVLTHASGVNVPIDAAVDLKYRINAAAGASAMTFAIPANPVDSDMLLVEIKASTVALTVNWVVAGTNSFQYGAIIPSARTIAANGSGIFGARYSSNLGKWQLMAWEPGA